MRRACGVRVEMASSLNWGDVPTWIAAIGGLVILLVAYAAWRSDVAIRREQVEESRRAQANLVTAWTDFVETSEITDRRDYSIDDMDKAGAVVVANRSDRATGEVFWTLWDLETETRMDSGYIRSLPPKREEVIFVPGPSGGDPIVHLRLIDANGLDWFRTDRVLSVQQWFDESNAKLRDPANTWERTWPPELVRRLRVELRDHQVLEYNDEDVRVAIYETLASTGQPPTVHNLVQAFGGPYGEMRKCLRRLADDRHLVIDGNEAILMAPPFSALPMGFAALGSRNLWWGGGVWNTFAMPHVLADEPRVLLATQCPACGTPQANLIEQEVPPRSDQVAHFLVPVDRMWADIVGTCRDQRLFCDEACVHEWLAAEGHEVGYILDLETLWRLAKHSYDEVLERGYSRRTPEEEKRYFEQVGLTGAFWGMTD